ncbi:MAG: serine/threonine protein kinase [Kofleriaceae bacterium]|nr:serine/threonine protein kinase [Kofleriaceae bacterium]
MLDPLSSSQAPLGTRDGGRALSTRIESPAAKQRTPAAPRSRPTRPPPAPAGERAEERLGQVLGSYRILELLGRGGMGFVYKAEHVKLGRIVALKLLRADYAKRRDSVARFFQEARTVNRVRHRNIVDVTDFVELDDGTTFIIMELLEGTSLGKWARKGVSVPRALALLVQICDGLAAAHAVGVIHRDLKPDNVFVIPTGDGAEVVKLLDFGVAKLLNREDEPDLGLETQAGSVIGTPAYMSPEQAGGLTVDARSDLYSLGAIMYELFCGQPMFKGKSFGEYVRKHLSERPPTPRSTPGGAGMDERLEAAILRCIEKEPARRYQDLGELRDELLHLLGAIETHVGLVRDLADSLTSADLIPASTGSGRARAGRVSDVGSNLRPPSHAEPIVVTPAPAPPRAPRWPWLVGGAAVLGAVGIAAAIATGGASPKARRRRRRSPRRAPRRRARRSCRCGPTASASWWS